MFIEFRISLYENHMMVLNTDHIMRLVEINGRANVKMVDGQEYWGTETLNEVMDKIKPEKTELPVIRIDPQVLPSPS